MSFSLDDKPHGEWAIRYGTSRFLIAEGPAGSKDLGKKLFRFLVENHADHKTWPEDQRPDIPE